jgi:hypothetical protein
MSESTEKKKEKPDYETPAVVKLDDVATASGQGNCTTGSAAPASCAAGGVATAACATGGTNAPD